MSDYLNNLLARTRNLSPVVQPRIASLFEPAAAVASNNASGRPFFEANALGEAHAESEASPQISSSLPTQSGQSPHTHLQSTIIVPAAAVQQKRGEGDVRYESREDSSRHTLPPLSTVTPPPAPPKLPSQSARTAPDAQRETVEILRPFRSAPETHAPREADERIVTPRTSKTNDQETWAGLELKVRQIVREELAPLQRAQARTSADGGETSAPQPTQASTSPVTAQTPDKRPQKSAQVFPLEIAEPSHAINVSIGRVDVRAIISQQAAPDKRPAAQKSGALSLDDYLKQRSGGRR